MKRPLAVLGAAAAILAGCGGGSEEDGGEPVLRVYVSLPLSGPAAAEGRDAADGAQLALADAGSEAGGVAVEVVVLDAAASAARGWTPAAAAANAGAAAQDSTAIAYLGDLESGATRASLPITNEARMLHVSPASTATDLVAPFSGSEEVPEVQPSGERTFGRVIASDELQARAAARWARELGWRQVAIESDGTRFAETLADAFGQQAERLGIELTPGAPRFYLAGEPRARPGEAIGSDALLPPYRRAAPAGLLVTSAALDPAQLPAAGQDLARRFRAEYGRQPGRYAAYGYEAMAVVLDSIEHASDATDRAAVIEAFFATADRESVLGTYSIDELGEPTLDRISGYEVDGRGRARAATELSGAD